MAIGLMINGGVYQGVFTRGGAEWKGIIKLTINLHSKDKTFMNNKNYLARVKKLIYFLVLLYGPGAFCQSKFDNSILIIGKIPYSKIREAFFKNGFVPENADTSYIITNAKELRKWPASLKIIVARNDSSILLKGLLKGSFSSEFSELVYRGKKGSQIMDSWSELEKIARDLGEFYYTKK